MRKRINNDIPDDGAQEKELLQELERLLNENNALMKVLKKITAKEILGTDNGKSDSVKGKSDKDIPGNGKPK
jgi:hypothetical protein